MNNNNQWSLPHGLNVSFNFYQCVYIQVCVCAVMYKISENPERSLSEWLWHLPQSESLTYIHTRTVNSKDHIFNPPLYKQWIKHTVASFWCFDPRHKHEYIQHINSILPNLRWLVMWPPYPACNPICDDTSAPPFHTNKLTNTTCWRKISIRNVPQESVINFCSWNEYRFCHYMACILCQIL